MTTTNQEYHVASFVAQAPPNNTSALSELINQFKGAEVHGCSEEGKIVFTVEADTQKVIAQIIEKIHLTDEFFSISPVYHQCLNEAEHVELTQVN